MNYEWWIFLRGCFAGFCLSYLIRRAWAWSGRDPQRTSPEEMVHSKEREGETKP